MSDEPGKLDISDEMLAERRGGSGKMPEDMPLWMAKSITNIDKLSDKHPKTNFLSFGKCLNALNILSSSLDMKQGKDLAKNLNDLYIYCSEKLREYIEDKDDRKLVEVRDIISGLLEAWEEIKD